MARHGSLGIRTFIAALLLVAWGGAAAHAGGVTFEANRGQVDEPVKFLARGPGYTAFFTATDAVLALSDGRRGSAVVRLKPLGANPSARIAGDTDLPAVVNYARRDAKPITAPTYARVRYADLYPGIDLVYYGRGRHLEYDFVLAPGADPGLIALAVDGAERVEIDARGDLVLQTAAGELRQPRPLVYQDIDGARHTVAGDYVLDGEGRIRIRLGAYDASHRLVIDPVLAYSTYLGGSNDESDSLYPDVVGIARDANGNTYVTGTTTSVDFPTTPGAYRTLWGSQDAFVTKFSPTGAVLYSTYLGGPCKDVGNAIAVDAAGNAYVTGNAHSLCFFGEASPGAFVAKLDPTGAVLWALVFGGAIADTSTGRAITVDAAGQAYVTGETSSPDFPTSIGAFRTESCPDVYLRGWADGFVAKVSADGGSLLASTFLCGNGYDAPAAIVRDAAGNVYVAGSTRSPDFPTVNPLQATSLAYPFGNTGFVSKLTADLSQLVYSTYLGGSISDVLRGLAVDGQGNAYVTGTTQSEDFPTTPGTLQPQRGNLFCISVICSDAFVAKINAAGSALVYSTYLYGEGHDGGHGIAVDATGHAYVVGSTASIYFPVVDAFQPATSVRGPSDAFVAKLSPDGKRLVFSSYFGGNGGAGTQTGAETGSAITIDGAGNAYVAGFTRSLDLPTTPGASQPNLGGGACDFFGSPCGDAFFARITAGPSPTPPTRLAVTPAQALPGGLVTATWAGVPIPTAEDLLYLYPLGGKFDSVVHIWSTGGTAAGNLLLALPAALPFGTYELRLMNPDGPHGGVLEAVTRSAPIYVGLEAPATADLVVADVATVPAAPVTGQQVAVTVTVTNQGTLASTGFAVDFYKDRGAVPAPGAVGDVRCAIAALAPAASAACTGTVTYAAAGTFTAWAQVDTGQAVPESSETNNVAGPRAITVTAPAAADLLVVALTNPPVAATPGTRFSVTDTARNQGLVTAGASTTRYHLSTDTQKGAGDRLFTTKRAVASLAPGAVSTKTMTLTIPTTTPPGTYVLLACADDLDAVVESDEQNNCRASAGTVTVGLPDLVQQTVSNPAGPVRRGTKLTVSDTVRNAAPVATPKSTTRYYLSLDGVKSANDVKLTGSRTVPILAAGAMSSGSASVTVPSATAPGTYVVFACADDAKGVDEGNEANNCAASATPVTVIP